MFKDRSIKDVQEWRALVFPDGVLQVPDPSDGERWDAFVAWVHYANPELAEAAGRIGDQMHGSFRDQLLLSL